MLEYLNFFFIGAGVGLISSFLGFGGGTIMVPFLPLIAGLDIKSAIVTSLTAVSINAANNTYNFQKKNLVPWNSVFIMAIGSVLFGILSSRMTHIMDFKILRWVVIVVFILLTVFTYFGAGRVSPISLKKHKFYFVGFGAIAGMASGFGGIGGGTFLVPLLLVFQMLPNEKLAPTGNAINMITAAVTASTLALSGQAISWKAVGIILIVSAVVSHYARAKQHLLSAEKRRILIIVFMILVIVLQIYEALKTS